MRRRYRFYASAIHIRDPISKLVAPRFSDLCRPVGIVKASQDRVRDDRNNDELRRLKQSFAASELESERAFNDALSEVFPPREYVAFNRYLIGKSRVSVGAVRMLSDYLRLNDSQKVRFEKARTIILTTTRDTKHQSSEAEFIQAMTDAENSLDRQQLEEFNKAVGRIPGNSSLRDYYVRLSKEQQLRLCGAYTVFREIRDEIYKETMPVRTER